VGGLLGDLGVPLDNGRYGGKLASTFHAQASTEGGARLRGCAGLRRTRFGRAHAHVAWRINMGTQQQKSARMCSARKRATPPAYSS